MAEDGKKMKKRGRMISLLQGGKQETNKTKKQVFEDFGIEKGALDGVN